MTIELLTTTAVFAASMAVVAIVGLAHERRAMAREARAIERHEKEMKSLEDNARSTRAAIAQRARLENQVAWILQAIENHAEHLEQLGIDRPQKHIPQELLK